ncbi:MAG: helix-turn-helix domain-containing protein [Verrucomicrobiota bacterium]
MKNSNLTHEKHTIPAVNKAMDLIRVLAEEDGETTTKALAIRLGVPRTTCYRILRSLVVRDWVRQVEDGRHIISLGLLPLLKPLQQVEHLAELVQPTLETLSAQARMAAKVSVRQSDYAVTIARCESPRQTSVAVRIGASFHLVYGSSGAVLLSGLDTEDLQEVLKRAPDECWARQKPEDVLRRIKEFQSNGWCADAGSFAQSVHAISAPLRDSRGAVLAAMTLVGFPHELPMDQMTAPAKLLGEAIRRVEKDLRTISPPSISVNRAKTKK